MKNMIKIRCAWLLVEVACLLCVSCIQNPPVEARKTKKVVFYVKTINVAIEPMQIIRAEEMRAPIYDDDGGQELTDLYLFVDGDLACHQQNSQMDFGTIELEMEYGDHDVTVVATRSDGQHLTNGVLEVEALKPTFGLLDRITILDTDDSFVLEITRITASLLVEINDEIPAGASFVRIQIADKYDDLSVSDFSGLNAYDYTKDIPIDGMVGNTGVVLSIAMLCPQYLSAYNTDVDITIYNENGGVISHHAIDEVPIKSNTKTRIFGDFFTPMSFSVMVNYDWDEGVDVW